MGAFNLLLENLDPLAQLMLQALFRSFWQGLILVAMVWLLLRVFKQTSATTRHAVWLASLLIIAGLPLIAIATRRDAQPAGPIAQVHRQAARPQIANSLPPVTFTADKLSELRAAQGRVKAVAPRLMLDADRGAQVDSTDRMVTLAETARVAPVTSPQFTSPPPVIKKTLWQRMSQWASESQWPLGVMAIWLLVCTLMLARIVGSYHSLFRLRRTLVAAAGAQQDRVRYLADLFGIRRRVGAFTSARVTMPMTVGAINPIIVLPPDLARTLSAAEFDSVVAHELAHIKRWDYLTNLLQRLAQAFLFFHPAVWFIGRQLMIERELACDDWAVKMCEPRRYASCLARLVEILSDSRPLAAAAGILFGKHVISRRVEMVLNRNRNATTAVSKPAVAYAIGLAAMLVAVCSMLSPVIAIPPGQQARKQKKDVKVIAPSPSTSSVTPLPPLPPEALPESADLIELAGVPDAPIAPLPPDVDIVALPEFDTLEPAVISVQDPQPVPPAPVAAAPAPATPVAGTAPIGGVVGGVRGGIGGGIQGGVATTIAPVAVGGGFFGQLPTVTSAGGWAQDDKNKSPAIPEAELLSLLTDIVKRDSDPNVRNEALQGIYRMRSDAAINTLIQLYDSVSDPKTKSEIIAYMLRRNGDNSKAIAKLTQIAKTETNEDLRNRAIRYLGNVKGDEGASNLIAIYDSLQDQKMKQYVIRSLAYNKSGKAIEKLKQIAKNDADPVVRSAAIRSLYGIDNRLYVETLPPGARIGRLDGDVFRFDHDFKFESPRAFEFDGKQFQFDAKKWEEMQQEWQEKWRMNQDKYKELIDKMQFEGLDKLRLEMPQIELKLKEIEQRIKEGKDMNMILPLQNQLRVQIAQVTAKLDTLRSRYTETHPTVIETRSLLNSLQRQLDQMSPTSKTVVRPAYRVTPQPRPAKSSRSVGTGSADSASSSF